ncbi:MAG: 1-acyl-sn-glycerol-3-phosphate acyltransferase [Myxococcales bacterium]|nr:1-acyl-sn-glycerol-3-phosphate acyltransferase [Myxococcales bacterium]
MFRSPRPELGDLRGPLEDWGGVRSVLTWGLVALRGLVAILGASLLVLAGGLWWDRDRRAFHAVNRWWGRSVMDMFPGRVELRGLANLEGGPVILAANHQSVVDLLVLYKLPTAYRTVVKRSWLFSPFGVNIGAAGYVLTPKKGEEGGGARVVERCARWIARGVSVLIFPEGTRSRSWQVQRFKRGAFELAELTGAKVVPVAVAGTNDISHPSSFRFCFHPHTIIVEVMPPLALGQDGVEGLRERCYVALSARVDALRAELRVTRGQGPV